ncbi:TIGR04086 family membrane protein [Desmospora activa]|uniref:Putative membrane protein (TIGR04086 family) n=1 Tax=Desmospora activa DSM 45169 TaxID=1121389 RepID=A0A2T4Z8W1_9BACL|nr:TIGR04086 family membrane protein [Desmospora activa]PTM58328.1 putative membrane protein (TIGR04086 family) [Desmospora activa DSM 45169]
MKQSILDGASKPKLNSPLLSGLLIVFAIVLAGSVVTALLLRFTSITESSLPYFTYGINGIALLIGGWCAGRKAKQRGLLYGGLTGVLYVIIVLLIGFLAFDTTMRIQPVLFTICATGLSAIGGIFGVNTSAP